MRKRGLFLVCGAIILISITIGLYDYFVLTALRAKTYVISPLSVVNIYVAKPAFWSCAGILFAAMVLRAQLGGWRPVELRRICLLIGIMMMVVYCGLTALVLFTKFAANSQIALIVSMWLTKSTPVFLIPGVLIGAGIGEKKHSET